MSFFRGKKRPIYFITKSFEGKITQKSDLILSPEFYWAKRVTLNVRYLYEASKMSQSIFDGILPDGDFRYKVFKLSKKEFVFVAYNTEKILQELKLMGINIQMIGRIYTLQSEFVDIEIALKVDKEYGVVTNEGVITYLPLKLLSQDIDKSIVDVLNQKKLSGDYIYSKHLQKSGLNPKQSNQILSILMIFALILLFDFLIVRKERNILAEQKSSLIERYNLPQTSFQIKSLRDELSKVDKQQSGLKEAIRYIGNFKLSKEEFFSSISYKKSILRLTIVLKNTRREKEFKAYISKKYKIIRDNKIKNGYMIEVKL